MSLSDVRVRSVTRDNVQDAHNAPYLMQFLVPSFGGSDELPQYGTKARDYHLRLSVFRDSMWASAIHIATTKLASQNTEFTGDAPRLRDYAHQLLMNAEDGKGQVRFLSKQVRDFLTTDNGCFTEIVRGSGARGAKILGVMHLDSLRCTRTGDPSMPVVYRDYKNNEHYLKDYQVIDYADMPTSAETFWGMGLCAASRAWNSILKMAAIERYYREKIDGKTPRSIDLVNGINYQDMIDATEMAEEQKKARGAINYMGSILVPTLQDTVPQHVRINFAELPDQFDYEKHFNIAMLTYANALGLDPQDLQPLTGRPLGSGDQSLILDEKAEARGLVAFIKDFTHQWNENICPDRVLFAFVSSRLRREKLKTDMENVQTEMATTLVEKGVLNAAEARQWLVDREVLPKEFLTTPDQTAESALTDEEKPEAEPEPDTAALPVTTAVKNLETKFKELYTYKSETTDLYELGIKELVRQAYQGRVDAREFASQLKSLVKALAPEAYLAVTQKYGIDEADWDEQDRANIREFIARQYAAANDFAGEVLSVVVLAKKDQSALLGLYNRVTLWLSAMESLESQATMASQRNAMGTWELGSTEEHCKTCLMLNGKSHRLRWYTDNGYIPREPGSDKLECGGWRCDCKIRGKDGQVLI